MRSKRLVYNTVSSLVFQVTTIICGFILPRIILQSFGSEINGLVNSVAQFLNMIAFLELGVGAVVQSSLYKPLADGDYAQVSRVMASASRFFRHLARILLIYIGALMLVYPYLAKQDFGWFYTAALIGAMGISSFAQYYFGVVDRLVLTAAQRGFVSYTAQTAALIANTLACVLLIGAGASIHMVKLTTSFIYLLRPLFLRMYVNRRYPIDRHIRYEGEPIRQKWNGVAQHIAAVVLDGTDTVVLTLFSSLQEVSVYSVYHLVFSGIKQLLLSMANGMQALIGELWARQELEELKQKFGWFEWAVHTGTIFVFGCTGTLILPFVQVYTKGVTDADYIRPLFAVLMTAAHGGHCLRLPYNTMILAGGHYKQTQKNYIVAACLNLVISILAVNIWGLAGVALGTLTAMLYQTIWMAVYDSRHLIKWPLRHFFKQLLADALTVCVSAPLCGLFGMRTVSYYGWVVYALKAALIWGVAGFLVNVLLYREKVKTLCRRKEKA